MHTFVYNSNNSPHACLCLYSSCTSFLSFCLCLFGWFLWQQCAKVEIWRWHEHENLGREQKMAGEDGQPLRNFYIEYS
jgi:hypothetical protein